MFPEREAMLYVAQYRRVHGVGPELGPSGEQVQADRNRFASNAAATAICAGRGRAREMSDEDAAGIPLQLRTDRERSDTALRTTYKLLGLISVLHRR